MAEKVLIVKYGEIAMRGNNKYIFINRLISAIPQNLDPYGNYYVVRDPGRLIVENRDGELDYDFTIQSWKPSSGCIPSAPECVWRITALIPSARKHWRTCRNFTAIRK